MNILLLAASLRKDSYNKKLAKIIESIVTKQGHKINNVDFFTFDVPLYNGDDETSKGLPIGALKFIEYLKNSDGLILASPEYNFSIPGTLKNLFDWVSRAKPSPFVKYPIMLASASPSMVGGYRGLIQILSILQAGLSAQVFTKMFSLANADTAFTEDNQLKDQTLTERLEKNIAEFLQFVSKA